MRFCRYYRLSVLQFDSMEQMPPGMRALVEKQLIQKRRTVVQDDSECIQEKEKKKQNKFSNKPTERLLSNGGTIKFRSKKEALFFDELKRKEAAGSVRNIRLEVQYLLKPAYTDSSTGERYRAINYLADFVYEEKDENGDFRTHIVDTKGGKKKGTRTPLYSLKKKLMADKGYFIEEF